MTRVSDRAIAIWLALYALGIAIWLTLHRAQSLIDDGFYYFKIAEHLARGDGSTFDGVHPTNGYHPLWAFLLVPIYSILPANEFARSVASIAQGVLFAASSAFFYLAARTILERGFALVSTLLGTLLAYRLSLSATEFSLQTLILSVIAFVYVRWFHDGAAVNERSYLELGILLSIAFLARIENLALAFALGIFMLGKPRKLIYFALPIVLVFFVYAIANAMLFNYPLPISGAVKLAWSDYYLAQDLTFQNRGWVVSKIALALLPLRGLFTLRHLSEMLLPAYIIIGSYGAAIVFALAWMATRVGRGALYRRMRPLAPFMLYSIVSVLGYVILFQGFLAYTPWYFVIQPWLTALGFAIALQLISDRFPPKALARRAVVAVALLVAIGIATYTLRSVSFPVSPFATRPRDPLEKAAFWLKDNTPSGAIVGSWNAGIMSYYSQRRVVNLDGLVNSWEYFQREQYDLCQYWDKNNIQYIADVFDDQRALSPVPSYPYYKKCAGQLELVWSDDIQGISGRVQVYFLRR